MLEKRSFALVGHRTSIALETEFWRALERIAASRGLRLVALLAALDASRDAGTGLASALRVHALTHAAK